MASCTECVHVEVCRYYTNELAKANGIPLKLEEVERLLECDDCENFKDRARFVELPCKIGDIVYGVNGHPDYGYEIAVLQAKDVALICRCGDLSYSKRLNSFGKTIFLTRESAEQTLKERENNG